MTKRFDLYGWPSMALEAAAETIERALGISTQLHDSSYRGGTYYRGADDGVEELILQTNFVDHDGYFAEADHPEHGVLVYVTDPSAEVAAKLQHVSGLKLLRTEVI
jgi:hypothetical protein